MAKLPPGYRQDADGCWSCAACFVETEYDEGQWYLCGHEPPERPTCTSVEIGEYKENGLEVGQPEFWAADKAWRAWSEGRVVKPWGKCDFYRRKAEPQAS